MILLAELVLAGVRALKDLDAGAVPPGRDIAHLGRLLFSDYLYAFEITSLLILAGLVGALALAGIPPTAGFLGKFYIFSAAVAKGQVLLVVAAVLASLIAAAYYLKVIVAMYMREAESDPDLDRENPALYLVIFLCLFGVVQLGVWPGNLLTLIRQAFSVPF